MGRDGRASHRGAQCAATSASPRRPPARCAAGSRPTGWSSRRGPRAGAHDQPGRAAADAIFRRHALLEWLLTSVVGLWLGGERRRGGAPPGRALAARRGQARRAARPPGDVPARQPDRPRDRAPPPGRRAAVRAGVRLDGRRSCGSPRRPRRTPGCCPTSRRARSRRAPTSRSCARSESLDSLTLDGPRGRATLGPAPGVADPRAPGEADPALFHRVPAGCAGCGLDPEHVGSASARVPSPDGNPRACPPTSASASRPARPARSTSAPRARRCSTTCSPATPAARSSSASRTRTSPAARPPSRRTSSTGLHWLGITWDEGPGVAGAARSAGRTRRTARCSAWTHYAAAAAQLLAKDLAYRCYCTPEELEADRTAQEAAKQPPRYVGRCAHLTADERAAREAEGRRGAIRFRVRPGVVGWDDLVRDRVEIDTAQPRRRLRHRPRATARPLYHFTVVVDDTAMQISHVIRGEDHVSNTPKHILLFEALGYPSPGLRATCRSSSTPTGRR